MHHLFRTLFPHRHNVIPANNEEQKSIEISSCNSCKLPILSNQFYKCRRCNHFKLHESCRLVPPEIMHPRHPNHKLILKMQGQNRSTNCSFCEDILTDMQIYTCEDCPSFAIDILCASPVIEYFRIDHRSHSQYQLISLSEEALFLCHACGARHQGRPLLCNLCGFWIDRGCARLPMRLKAREYHQHSLDLLYSLPESFSSKSDDSLRCEICGNPINSRFWVYYCSQCGYFAHLRCATSATEPFMSIFSSAKSRRFNFEDEETIRLPVESEFVYLVSHLQVAKRYRDRDDPLLKEPKDRFPEDDRGHRFIRYRDIPAKKGKKDFLSSNQRRNEGTVSSLCNACVQPISPTFYRCTDAKCNFLVHTNCFEAPFEIRYQHSGLYLVFQGLDLKIFFGVFNCDVCFRPCNGYHYRRSKENGVLDVKCALAPEYIVHDSHQQHRLILSKRRYGPCPCCLLAGEEHGAYMYRCETCSFNLHQKCALYPRTARHRYDRHPLRLTYKPVIDIRRGSDECYCEICELEVNRRGWFYHCVECDQSFHSTCIPAVDHLSNIKFGGILKLECHSHPLILDKILLDLPCRYCNEMIKDGMAFQCKEECKRYQIHFQCAKSCSLSQGLDTKESIFASWDTGNLDARVLPEIDSSFEEEETDFVSGGEEIDFGCDEEENLALKG